MKRSESLNLHIAAPFEGKKEFLFQLTYLFLIFYHDFEEKQSIANLFITRFSIFFQLES